MARLVYVEGIIGVGKSTALSALKDLGHTVVFEDVDNWTLWKKRCLNPERFSFPFQVEVCLSMLNHFRRALKKNRRGTIFCERSMLSSLVFALSAPITKEEKRVLEDLIITLHSSLNKVPAHFVYLKCDPDVAMNRIRKRNRAGEHLITTHYLKELDHHYNSTIEFKDIIDVTSLTPDQVVMRLCHQHT